MSFLTFLPFLPFLAACHPSPDQQRQQSQQQQASWDATARLTAELAHRGALPRVYVRQVHEAVEQGRKKAQQQVQKSR